MQDASEHTALEFIFYDQFAFHFKTNIIVGVNKQGARYADYKAEKTKK